MPLLGWHAMFGASSFYQSHVPLQGMESYCVRAFSEALEIIPYTLAENAGMHPIEIVTELRNHHASGRRHHGKLQITSANQASTLRQ